MRRALSTLVLFGFAILIALAASVAHAQTVQPVYIRPSKGQALTLPDFVADGFGYVTGSVYDWSAFDSIQIYGVMSQPCVFAAAQWSIDVLGATSATGTFNVIKGSFNQTNAKVAVGTNPAFYPVSGLPPFIKLRVGRPGNIAGCTLSITIVPYPLSLIQRVQGPKAAESPNIVLESDPPVLIGGIAGPPGGASAVPRFFRTDGNGYQYVLTNADPGSPSLPATSPVPVAASPAAPTAVFVSGNAQPPLSVVLQNAGTSPVVCAWGPNSNLVSLTRYNFALAASTAANNGTGGRFEVDNYTSNSVIYCLGNGGASSIALTPK